MTVTTHTTSQEAMEDEDDDFVDAEEKGLLPNPPNESIIPSPSPPTDKNKLSNKFWISAAINSAATVAIIFLNKCIFTSPSLRHAQVTFAAFHFLTTYALLYFLSHPPLPSHLRFFSPKRVDPLRLVPLALCMIANVVLPNASLAYSSIPFYQIMRVLVTPCVCALDFILLAQKTPTHAVLALVPVCVGVGWMSWADTHATSTSSAGNEMATSSLGVFFACTGVLATSLYTVWIKKYHAALECSSMQLLLNQAPVSVVLMLYIIPFADDVTVWTANGVGWGVYGLVLLSGGLACLITVTQFVIIHEAGPVSSTVVGHFKTCLVILLSWMVGRKHFSGQSLMGVGLALGGIISYSLVMHRQPRT